MFDRFNAHCRRAGLFALLLTILSAHGQTAPNLDLIRDNAEYAAKLGDYGDAIEEAQRLLKLTEVKFGPRSVESADAAGFLGRLHQYDAHDQLAEQLYKQQLDILKSLPGSGGIRYPIALLKLGMFYRERSRFKDAEPLLEQALTLAQQQLRDSPDLAYAYNDLGLVEIDLKRYDRAESLLKTALKIRESQAGVDKDLLAISHDNLGNLYIAMGRLPEAEEHLLKALPLFREKLGDSAPDTLICVENLSDLYKRTNRQEKAIDLLSATLTAAKSRKNENQDLVDLLLRRGNLYLDTRRFSEAEADFEQVLADPNVLRSEGDPRLLRALLDLGHLYGEVREYAKGDAVLHRAQTLEERRPDRDPEALSNLYSRRGWFQMQLQNWDASESFLQKALNIDSAGGDARKLTVATTLNNLAEVRIFSGKLEAALPEVRRAIEIEEKDAPQSVDLAESFDILGSALERLGQSEQAEEAYRHSVQLYTSSFGARHPGTVNAQSNLGLLLASLGKSQEALQMANSRAAAFEDGLQNLLASGTEEQALSFVRSQNPFAFFGTLGQPEPLEKALINYKGAVTDAMFERRRAAGFEGTSEQKDAFNRWRTARRQFSEWMMKESAGDDAGQQPKSLSRSRSPSDLKAWQAKRDQLAATLARAQADITRYEASSTQGKMRFAIGVADVQRAIPPGTALIDFVRYSHDLGKAKLEDRYGAVLLTSGGSAQWIPLGRAWDIEQTIAALQRAILGADPVVKLPEALRSVCALVVDPVLSKLPAGTQKLLISPDGELNFVSFGTLLTPRDRFLAEQYSITYVTSARALLNRVEAAPNKQVLLFANPRFRLSPKAPAPVADTMLGNEFRLPVLNQLPFTAQEANSVERIAVRSGWSVTRREDLQATEVALQTAKQPGILHLATHGFYLPRFGADMVPNEQSVRGAGGIRQRPPATGSQPAGEQKAGMSMAEAYERGIITNVQVYEHGNVALDDPMLRSGVALTGAQDTLERWRHGQIRPTGKDGVLNAEEAASLDLQGTWIVTLSSCDSGLGESEPGEGIFGLRRALLQAGAHNVLTTLWPVSDALTPTIMAAFYEQAFATHDAPAALAEVQRRFLVQLRKEKGLDAAVRLAGAFVMTSQAPVQR